jgi:hypothetical protein
MSFLDVLRRLTSALDRAGIAYMLTGSFASVYYGLPRSTQDIDLVIAADPEQLKGFIGGLSADEYYSDMDAALRAHHHKSLFNIIDMKTAWKIDMIFRKDRAFSRMEFSRRQRVEMEGVSIFVASAEDVILAKLEWSKLARSHRQIEDVAGILKIRYGSLDRPYLETWIQQLGVENEWTDALHLARVEMPPLS